MKLKPAVIAALLGLAVALLVPATGRAQGVSVKAGESIDIAAVYWINNCKSLLKSIVGVDIMSGPPGISLAIRPEPVMARRQNCPQPVPGGIVVITAAGDAKEYRGKLQYRVRYDTLDGPQQSSHSVDLTLFP